MGCHPKGKCSTTPANVPQQSKLSSFFAPVVAPLFEGPSNSTGASQAGSAAGAAGSASGAGAASAAGGAGAEPETVVVIEDNTGVDGDVTSDDDATESD
eukprot:851600-Rhodomonas_salina.1